MSFSYDHALSRPLDQVRFLLSDKDKSAPVSEDEEIIGSLALFGSPFQAAAAICDGLAAKYSAGQQNFSIGGELTITYGDRAASYRKLAAVLRTRASIGKPLVSGVSIADQDAVRKDTDREPNRYNVGQDDFPGRISPQTTSPNEYPWPSPP